MKLRLLILFFCIFSSCLMGQETKTRLSIKTNSEHSFIYVNGIMQGRGSLEIDLAKGNYKITVKESVLNWSGFELTDSIKISGAEKKMEKFYSLQKQVLINSEPENAQVLAKDSVIGYTPLFIPSNISNVTILKDRYASRHINLNNTNLPVVDLGLPVENNSGGFVKTVWFKVLIGTAAVLGATAAYYKIQADKKYDDYLENKSSSSLSEVNRLDSISGVALGAFQINFGVLIYFLLFD